MNKNPKKLIFYIDAMYLGGANRVMANLANHFSGIVEKTILVNDIHPEQGWEEYKIEPKVQRFFLQRKKTNVLTKNFFRILDLRRLIEKEKPDVIISFMGPPNIRMLIATVGLPVKKIVSVRNDPKFEYGTGLKRIAARMIFSLADGIVFQTKDAAEYFPQSVRRKSKIIFNPVNPKFYDFHWKPGGTEIVVVGRLQPQKNPMNVLRAFEMICDKIPEITLGFYGDGELKTELECYANDVGIDERVTFHGRTDKIEHVLENAALFVLCSDYEGMPNALMEAMAVGVPVIATDSPCGGSRALIENTNQGILVPCKDSEKLADAMLDVLLDAKKQRDLSYGASERAIEFIPEKVLKEWELFI